MPDAPRSLTAPQLDAIVDVETPEQVLVSYTLAGVGARAVAALVDTILLLLLLGAMLWGVLKAFGKVEEQANWLVFTYLVVQFLILWGYFLAFEALWDGQTPGKRLLRLRVVRTGGGGVDIAESAARNLLRVIDFLPFGYFAGMVSVVATQRNQRLGDLVAGTIVVRERPMAVVAPPPVAEAETSERPPAPTLDDATFTLLERFLAREAEMDPDARGRITSALVLRTRVPVTVDAVAALRALHGRELRARARAAPVTSAAGLRREEWAIVAEGRSRWEAFGVRIAETRRRGLSRIREEEVTAFVAEYRETATDLARLRTADRGRGGDAVFALSRLVAGAHNLIYRRPSQTAARVLTFMAADVPREVRRSWRFVLVSSLLLFVPAFITIGAIVRNPALAEQLLPPSMLQRAEEGRTRANTGGDYLPSGEERAGAGLSGMLMTNNVKVALLAFAGGITVGVLTVLSLVFNGIAALGAGVGLYIVNGIGGQILGFVAAHGVLELAAICISGAGGLLLAAGVLLPGERTRRVALVENAKRALTLLACAVLFLVIAGVIEGNISPSRLPDSAKYATSLITAVAMLWYLSQGRDYSSPRALTDR
jgi:uncharacterized membrane protein SpoIIM required for sporulation/uncharacterized RDD family membrane protein YckC